ncbi:MAG: aminoglycoside phosphotransferase family protein [Friedmanniella sp.]|nr:aminoglycoside phosphotransferase family protein [Friedmanniella sp.]
MWVRGHLGADLEAVTPVRGGRTDTIWAVRIHDDPTPAVLRWMPVPVWGEVGRRHVRAEALGCRLMAGSALPTPHLVATDPDGSATGGYANLTSWLPGRVRLDPLGPAAVEELARVATVLHRTPVPLDPRPEPYAFWAPDPLTVPPWSPRPELWERAIAVFLGPRPDTPAGLVHRDFHPGNILWDGDRVTGVIDWAETSWGPPDLDVAHALTNFALLLDPRHTEVFLAAYRGHGGVLDPDLEARRFWAVSDILGFLPDPVGHLTALTASRPELTPEVLRARLEAWLVVVLAAGPG